jgi:hypothetical protein
MTDLTDQERAAMGVRLGALARFAGWLGKGRASDDTRAHVKALSTAYDDHTDAGRWIILLEADLERVPSGEVRKMIRKELEAIAILLTRPARAGETGLS